MVMTCPVCRRREAAAKGEFRIPSRRQGTPNLTEATTRLRAEVLRAQGRNGQLQLTGQVLRIRRSGVVSFLSHGLKGDKEIRIDRISSVQFRSAGPIVNGYIQIGFAGGLEAKGGVFEAARDENTVMFTEDQEPEFRAIKRAIERRLAETSAASTPAPSPQKRDGLDDLERLAALRDRGILTEEEFQAKKRQILGL